MLVIYDKSGNLESNLMDLDVFEYNPEQEALQIIGKKLIFTNISVPVRTPKNPGPLLNLHNIQLNNQRVRFSVGNLYI
jgi:hypothetical protein